LKPPCAISIGKAARCRPTCSSTSPLGWQHINLTGDYLWSDPAPRDGELRPFRQTVRLPA
jgi:hypothetical protein